MVDTVDEQAMASTSHDSTARAILYAFLANFGIALAKSWAAVHVPYNSLVYGC